MKQNAKNGFLVVFVATFLVAWCAMPDEEIKSSEIISVSGYENSLSEKPAVSVSFGESQTNYCRVTILKSNLNTGYSVYSLRQDKYQEISFDCNWDGVSYIQNANLDTYVALEVLSVDPANKKAEIVISARLKEHKKLNENPSGDSAELNKLKLVITGQHFDKLTKAM